MCSSSDCGAAVKYEDIYLHAYATPREVTLGLRRYFRFYNERRGHQNLDYQTPQDDVPRQRRGVKRRQWRNPTLDAQDAVPRRSNGSKGRAARETNLRSPMRSTKGYLPNFPQPLRPGALERPQATGRNNRSSIHLTPAPFCLRKL